MERLAGYEIVEKGTDEFFVAIDPQPNGRGGACVSVEAGSVRLNFTDSHVVELPDFPSDIADLVRSQGEMLVGEMGEEGLVRAYVAKLIEADKHA